MYKGPTAYVSQINAAVPFLCYAVSKFWGIVQGFGLPRHIIDSQVKSFLKLWAPFCFCDVWNLLFVAQVGFWSPERQTGHFLPRVWNQMMWKHWKKGAENPSVWLVLVQMCFFLRKWGFTMQYYRRACVVLTSQCLGVCLSPLRSLNSIDPRNLRLDFLLQVVEHNMSKGTLSSSRTCSRCQISYVACLNDRANIFCPRIFAPFAQCLQDCHNFTS